MNVHALAAKYAKIETDRLPVEVDALLLYKTKHSSKPTIILNEGRSRLRERFTLAHELGHLVIPWHVGELAFNLDRVVLASDQYFYKAVEAEASRFASQLLMPRAWLEAVAKECERKLRRTVGRIQAEAEVSLHAACMGAIKVAKPGTVLFELEADNIIHSINKASGFSANLPAWGTKYSRDWFNGLDNSTVTMDGGGSTFHFVVLSGASDMPEVPEGQSSSDILARVLSRSASHLREKFARSINGVVGAAVSHLHDVKPPAIYLRLLERFLRREDALPPTADKEFKIYLAARARELSNR